MTEDSKTEKLCDKSFGDYVEEHVATHGSLAPAPNHLALNAMTTSEANNIRAKLEAVAEIEQILGYYDDIRTARRALDGYKIRLTDPNFPKDPSLQAR